MTLHLERWWGTKRVCHTFISLGTLFSIENFFRNKGGGGGVNIKMGIES